MKVWFINIKVFVRIIEVRQKIKKSKSIFYWFETSNDKELMEEVTMAGKDFQSNPIDLKYTLKCRNNEQVPMINVNFQCQMHDSWKALKDLMRNKVMILVIKLQAFLCCHENLSWKLFLQKVLLQGVKYRNWQIF